MHVATHCITDLRSLRAVIKVIRATGYPCKQMEIPLELWVRIRDEGKLHHSWEEAITRHVNKPVTVTGFRVNGCFVY